MNLRIEGVLGVCVGIIIIILGVCLGTASRARCDVDLGAEVLVVRFARGAVMVGWRVWMAGGVLGLARKHLR